MSGKLAAWLLTLPEEDQENVMAMITRLPLPPDVETLPSLPAAEEETPEPSEPEITEPFTAEVMPPKREGAVLLEKARAFVRNLSKSKGNVLRGECYIPGVGPTRATVILWRVGDDGKRSASRKTTAEPNLIRHHGQPEIRAEFVFEDIPVGAVVEITAEYEFMSGNVLKSTPASEYIRTQRFDFHTEKEHHVEIIFRQTMIKPEIIIEDAEEKEDVVREFEDERPIHIKMHAQCMSERCTYLAFLCRDGVRLSKHVSISVESGKSFSVNIDVRNVHFDRSFGGRLLSSIKNLSLQEISDVQALTPGEYEFYFIVKQAGTLMTLPDNMKNIRGLPYAKRTITIREPKHRQLLEENDIIQLAAGWEAFMNSDYRNASFEHFSDELITVQIPQLLSERGVTATKKEVLDALQYRSYTPDKLRALWMDTHAGRGWNFYTFIKLWHSAHRYLKGDTAYIKKLLIDNYNNEENQGHSDWDPPGVTAAYKQESKRKGFTDEYLWVLYEHIAKKDN